PPVPDSGALPSEPIMERDEQGVPKQFDTTPFEADPDTVGSGVCVFEPHLSDGNGPGAVFPQNWLRPRFRWTGTGSETAWEIKLTAPGQTNALRAYTTTTTWIMPDDTWKKIAAGIQDTDITVTIRGISPG